MVALRNRIKRTLRSRNIKSKNINYNETRIRILNKKNNRRSSITSKSSLNSLESNKNKKAESKILKKNRVNTRMNIRITIKKIVNNKNLELLNSSSNKSRNSKNSKKNNYLIRRNFKGLSS